MKYLGTLFVVAIGLWAAIVLLPIHYSKDQTDLGQCIGLDDREEPGLEYGWDVRNTVLAVVFVEAIAPPIYILLTNVKCPIARLD